MTTPTPVYDPTIAYTPKQTTELCEAAKDMLLFLRGQGFGCQHLEVTEKGVLIHGLRDDYPRRQVTARGDSQRPALSYDRDAEE